MVLTFASYSEAEQQQTSLIRFAKKVGQSFSGFFSMMSVLFCWEIYVKSFHQSLKG